jgi:hypothetical protein
MKRLALLVAAIAMAYGVDTAPSSAAGNNWYIDPELGTDGVGCGGASTIGPQPGITTASAGPCQSLNQALANGSAGDNFFIEKGGTFGPIFITGNISINGPADNSAVIEWAPTTSAGCLATGPGSCSGGGDTSSSPTYAVDVEAANSVTVKFKNIVISGGAAGATGVVRIGNCFGAAFKSVAIRGGSTNTSGGEMVLINPSSLTNTGGPVQIYFANTDIAFSPVLGGVYVEPTASVSMLFQNSEVHNGAFGLKLDASLLSSSANITAAIDATEFFSFSNSAVTAKTVTSQGSVHLLLARSSIVNTGSSAFNISGPSSNGILYEDVITGNQVGVNIANGGFVAGFGNSEIFGNSTNVSGTITEMSLQ